MKLSVKIILVVLLFSVFYSTYAQKVSKIDILNADLIEYDKTTGISAKRLLGNVKIDIDSAIMTCDSAYYYSEERIVDAFSNVHVIKNDTIHLYGNFMKYNGETQLIKVKEDVTVLDENTKLVTDSLDYNIDLNYGFYNTGGIITNEENRLTSIKGYFYPDANTIIFSDSVVFTNPDYTISSDSLKYISTNKTTYFLLETEIYNDENYIFCEKGYYNSELKTFEITKNALMQNNERILTGDSIYFDKTLGYGKAISNVEIIDTTQNVILSGEFAEYYEDPEMAYMTKKAILKQIIEDSDTVFIHADTILTFTDTLGYKNMKAYHKVKIFKSNLQGKCDSIYYSGKDTVIQMHTNPVLWSEENQLTSRYIEIYYKNEALDRLEMTDVAMIISEEDTSKYNQVKGKKMIGYFKNNELYKVDVVGNGQTIYFPKDGDEFIGMNKGECTNLTIYIEDKKPNRIIYLTKPTSSLIPLEEVPHSELKLKDFQWLDAYRPKTRDDIFKWEEKTKVVE